jgi:hypothetical protein
MSFEDFQGSCEGKLEDLVKRNWLKNGKKELFYDVDFTWWITDKINMQLSRKLRAIRQEAYNRSQIIDFQILN